MNLKIYTDGGARGNPGSAACAYVIYAEGILREKSGKYLGETTNNQAEYAGVRAALEFLEGLEDLEKVVFYLDSLLVVSQLRGKWKIKDPNLAIKAKEIRELIAKLQTKNSRLEISFNHVPREANYEADALVNKILDDHGAAA